MAKGKIGAIIALDGEKEFKQAVTDCNKSLSTLKSEMSLVKAETEGQANSLAALQKKHDVLSRVLEEQEKKQEAVANGLDHAKQSYDKVGRNLEDLKGKLSSATAALEEMKNSSDTTEEELKQQEKAVKELADAVAKGEKNYQTAGNRVKDWETKLNTAKAQVIKANAEVNRNAAYMKEAEEATDHCATSIDEFGKATQKATEFTQSYTEIIRNNLINTGVDALKGMAAGAASTVLELEDAANQMQASTGSSAEAMKEYKSVLQDVYANNYGDSLESVANTLGVIKQYTNETDPGKLQELTESAITLEDVFGMDLRESIRGVDALMTNMGISSEEAFDYMAKGAQNGLDKSGELADNIAEYSQLWGQAGFSAQEMFAILQNGLDSGAYNLDKVNDFVKEFSISLADGRIEDNISSFSEKTGNLFYAWKQGRASTKDVFNSVIDDLGTMTNKQDALTLASTVWSALGEDNAMSVITSLNKVNDTYDDVKGTMESIKDIKYDSLSNKWEELSRKFQMEIAGPVAEDFLPIAEAGLDALIDNMDLMIPAISGISTALGALKLASVFGAALNPVTLVAGALTAATVALTVYGGSAGDIAEDVKRLAEANDKVVQSSDAVVESAGESISAYDSTLSDISAKSEYAQTLADRIEALAGKTNRSNSETAVMKEYITQLNDLVPGLNLAYDAQARSLNLTNKEIEEYIGNSQKQLEIQAAEEYKLELIKKKSELEIEEIKLRNELDGPGGLTERKAALLENENEAYLKTVRGALAWIDGKADERKTYDELSESIEANQEATQNNQKAQEEVDLELEAANRLLKERGAVLNETTQATQNNTDAINNKARALEEEAAKEERLRQEQELQRKSMEEATAQVIEDTQAQVNIFSKATNLVGEELRQATSETLDNMESQMQAMENWAANLEIISDRGINKGLLQYLADMGPNGAEYVAQFAVMTDEEIKKANEMWERTMSATGIGATLAGGITEEINNLADELYKEYQDAAKNAADGYTDGVESKLDEVGKSSAKVGDKSNEAVRESLQEQSPSKTMHVIGENASIGLANGILSKIISVINASRMVAEYSVKTTQNILDQESFFIIGQNTSVSLANGILSGRRIVAQAAQSVGRTVEREIRASLDMHSPSTVLVGLGELSAESYGIGFEQRMRDVRAAVNQSMKFQAAAEERSSFSPADISDVIENALYNGMLSAMSRAKMDSGANNLQVNVTLGTNQMIEVLQKADDERRNMTGGIGLFERG